MFESGEGEADTRAAERTPLGHARQIGPELVRCRHRSFPIISHDGVVRKNQRQGRMRYEGNWRRHKRESRGAWATP